jgi:hypothetical protein
MNVRGKFTCLAILIAFCLVLASVSCAPGISQEEYDGVMAELATARADLDGAKAELTAATEQLAEASSAWSALQPELDIYLLLEENYISWVRCYSLEEITEAEYSVAAGNQWGQIMVALDAIGNEELIESLQKAWFAPLGAAERDVLWAEAYELLISETQQNAENLSAKLP